MSAHTNKLSEAEARRSESNPQTETPSEETASEVDQRALAEKEADGALEIPSGGFVGRVLSKTSTRISTDPGPPPDGGIKAWTQVLMSHLVVFNVWGYVSSFGVFQAYYVTTLGHPPSDISWVGSMQIFLLFFIGTLSGRATDAGFFRITYLAGAFFFLIGVFLTSLCTQYWHLFLVQGVCTGIGNGLLFCPSVTLLSTYFAKRKAMAIALTASGTATGGIVFPVIVQHLLPRIGFPWTIRVLGFVMLMTLSVAFAFLRTRLPPRKSGPIVDWAAFRDLPYLLFTIGMFFSFWSLYFAFYYIPSFGRDIIQISYTDSIDNLLIMNGVGLVGRVVPAYFADKYTGPMHQFILLSFVTGILLFGWTGIHNRAGLTVFCVLYGLTGAGIQSTFPATVTSLTQDLQKTGVRLGMVFSVVSFASLTGAPIGGALLQLGQGNYLYPQIFAGISMLVGCTITLGSRVAKSGWKKARV